MAWDSDLVAAVYTAPSGKKFQFEYDSKLSSEVDLKTATFTFPERDGALVVPLGIGGRRFSFTCYFYGKDCADKADDFEEGLKERGYGELQHPIYGNHKVVPTGTINRTDDVVASVGVSSVAVTFSETIIVNSVVNSEVLETDAINEAADKFEKKSKLEFVKDIADNTIKGAIWVADMYKRGMATAIKGLKSVAQMEKSIYTKFSTIESELWSNIDNLINAAEDIAVQTVKLLRLPAQVATNTGAKVEAYSSVVNTLASNFKDNPFGLENAKNQWTSTRLMLESLVTGCSCGAALDSGRSNFKTRDEAVECANMILDMYDIVVAFEEKNIAKDYYVETGESFGAMRDVVAKAVSMIINNSFALPTRKTIILGKDRQIVELVYDLYGDLSKLDQFILDNKINYNELEIIPMGREVAYYV